MKEREENNKKRLSIFQIVSMVLTVILLIAIVVQIGIIINLNNKKQDANNKNENLPVQEELVEEFDDFKYLIESENF